MNCLTYDNLIVLRMLKEKIVIVDITKKQKLVSEVILLSLRIFTTTKSS